MTTTTTTRFIIHLRLFTAVITTDLLTTITTGILITMDTIDTIRIIISKGILDSAIMTVTDSAIMTGVAIIDTLITDTLITDTGK